jgi:hypothetical protein
MPLSQCLYITLHLQQGQVLFQVSSWNAACALHRAMYAIAPSTALRVIPHSRALV